MTRVEEKQLDALFETKGTSQVTPTRRTRIAHAEEAAARDGACR